MIYVFRNSSVKRFVQIPLLSIGIEFECTNVPWEQKMLIGGLYPASIDFIISSWHQNFDRWKSKRSLAVST